MIRVYAEIPILKPDGSSNTCRAYSESEPRRKGRSVELAVSRCLKKLLQAIRKDAKAVSMDCQRAIKKLKAPS